MKGGLCENASMSRRSFLGTSACAAMAAAGALCGCRGVYPNDMGYEPLRVVNTGIVSGETYLLMVPAESFGLIEVGFDEEDLLRGNGSRLPVEDVEPGDVFDVYCKVIGETYPAGTHAERIVFVEHGGNEALEPHREEIDNYRSGRAV